MRDDINDKKVLAIVARLEAARAPVNQWPRWYDTAGTEALGPGKAPGPAPRLDPAQHGELTRLIEAELQAAGYRGSDHQGLPRPRRSHRSRRAEARDAYAGDRHDSCDLRWSTG